jgi:uncharacterized membrane-anchored protein
MRTRSTFLREVLTCAVMALWMVVVILLLFMPSPSLRPPRHPTTSSGTVR